MCNKKLWDTTIKVDNWSDIYKSMETHFSKFKHEYQETKAETNTALAISLLANGNLITRTYNNEIE
jgi:hypothetical protein